MDTKSILFVLLYSYLNLESTKTALDEMEHRVLLYSYLNLESTKTAKYQLMDLE